MELVEVIHGMLPVIVVGDYAKLNQSVLARRGGIYVKSQGGPRLRIGPRGVVLRPRGVEFPARNDR